MQLAKLSQLVEGTADAAFAIDGLGLISAWNTAAAELFGLISGEAIGRPCDEIVKGTDERGDSCSKHCSIQDAVHRSRPVANFDLQVHTKAGPQWCNISVLIVTESGPAFRHAIHIVRPREMRKRLEQLIRDFVANEAEMKREVAGATDVNLTTRETEILRLLAAGTRTNVIAEQLHISTATVNNHIRHILNKFDAHTRLEAIRRAERAGLV